VGKARQLERLHVLHRKPGPVPGRDSGKETSRAICCVLAFRAASTGKRCRSCHACPGKSILELLRPGRGGQTDGFALLQGVAHSAQFPEPGCAGIEACAAGQCLSGKRGLALPQGQPHPVRGAVGRQALDAGDIDHDTPRAGAGAVDLRNTAGHGLGVMGTDGGVLDNRCCPGRRLEQSAGGACQTGTCQHDSKAEHGQQVAAPPPGHRLERRAQQQQCDCAACRELLLPSCPDTATQRGPEHHRNRSPEHQIRQRTVCERPSCRRHELHQAMKPGTGPAIAETAFFPIRPC
jgi:hypothetical protein